MGTSNAIPQVKTSQLSPADLAHVLDVVDVPFVAGGSQSTKSRMPQPAALLAALASCEEARLRLALIPLLLRHPEYARHARSALCQMIPSAKIGFKCYYTAAVLLQRKYRERLTALLGDTVLLPDLFSGEVGMKDCSDPEQDLRALADLQKALTGRLINWQGTYEHGAQRLLRTLEGRKRCQT